MIIGWYYWRRLEYSEKSQVYFVYVKLKSEILEDWQTIHDTAARSSINVYRLVSG